MKQQKRKLVGIALVSGIASVVMILLALINPFEKMQLQLASYLYRERPTQNPVIIVAIDNKSLNDEQGLGKFETWSREYYARVIENLEKYDPSSIGVDILFQNENRGIAVKELKEIVGQTDQVIVDKVKQYAFDEVPPGDKSFAELIQSNEKIVILPKVKNDKDNFQLRFYKENFFVGPPAKAFTTKLWNNLGLNKAFLEINNSVIRIPLIYFIDNELYVSFALKNVLNKLNLAEKDLVFDEKNRRIKLAHLNIPLDESFQLLINYSKKTILRASEGISNPQIKLISFSDVYNNNFPEGFDPEIIRNNVVLIGAYGDYTNDQFRTPIDSFQMYGVMIHASAIQTILDQAWLRNMSLLEEVLVIVLLAFLSAVVIFSRLKIRYSLPILALAMVIYSMSLAIALFGYGLILNMVYPPLTVVLATIVGYAYRYVTEFKAKNMAAGALTKYVNADVAEQVIDGDIMKTGGDKREITVIFTDIRGFTSISEGLSPQRLVALLNEYFSVMTAVIVRCGGIVDKFEGDAIMAFFEGENHAQKAAVATLEMHEELIKWKKESALRNAADARAETWPDIEFRAGVSTGQAVVGNIGSSAHLQYTAIGDIVNLGSRLESANKFYETRAMVAEATFEQIKDQFECRFLDVIQVKGKEIPVKIYELIARKGHLPAEQIELIAAYNVALGLYFQRDFVGAMRELREKVLVRWPEDYLAKMYAERAELFSKNPPAADWNFVHKMESK